MNDDHERMWIKMLIERQKLLGNSLAEKAVFLRLDAGTQEAGFLSAFCSLEAIPKLVIIRYAWYNDFSDQHILIIS